MKIRNLELKDAPFMLEWMHDKSVTELLQADFDSKNINDCFKFIEDSKDKNKNIHFAIVDENDTYMGTISLKNITLTDAELAIAIRTMAMGKGISSFAINEIIKYAFAVLKLKYVYWYVSPKNIRAIKFYNKNGFAKVEYEDIVNRGILLSDSIKIHEFEWYLVINNFTF